MGTRQPHAKVQYWRQTFQPKGAVYGQDSIENLRGVLGIFWMRETETDPFTIAECERGYRVGFYNKWSRMTWVDPPKPRYWWERMGLYLQAHDLHKFGAQSVNARSRYVGVPYWLLVVLTAIPPGLWLRSRFLRRYPAGAGFCAACGYDLRATPDRCPECGTEAPKPRALDA